MIRNVWRTSKAESPSLACSAVCASSGKRLASNSPSGLAELPFAYRRAEISPVALQTWQEKTGLRPERLMSYYAAKETSLGRNGFAVFEPIGDDPESKASTAVRLLARLA
jgi:hypothetical protein